MIIGIGIDIVELSRIKVLLDKQDSFSKRILTPQEREEWEHLPKHRQVEYLAGRFAVKEALSKAMGTGIGKAFSFQDVSILSSSSGAPTVHWHKPSANIIAHISITHSREYACAQAVLEDITNKL